jgi:hypothetical protein
VIKFRFLVITSVMCTVCLPGIAFETPLDSIQSTLMELRGRTSEPVSPRGATAQLTVAKHQLRDWVESHFSAFPHDGDEGALGREINVELSQANLFCDDGCGERRSSLGYLHDITFRRAGSFLILKTALGIQCGSDDSAYLYSWSTEGWRRVWQTEQNEYTEKAYKPQTIHSVQVSPSNEANDYLVLTLGSQSWCSSVLHDVYFRAFRLGPDLDAPPLVNGQEWARIDEDPPIHGSVTATSVLVEFTPAQPSISYHAVRHYSIDHQVVKRVDPLALSPTAFLSEWAVTDWKEAAHWSESTGRKELRDLHTKFNGSPAGGFMYPTMHCPKIPDIWQVGVEPLDETVGSKATYFLVRWRPPYIFTMVQVSDQASPLCTEEDRAVDDEEHMLFPSQR